MTRHVVFVCALLLVPVAALAQGQKWEIEVHGGGTFASALSGGTSNLPGSSPLTFFGLQSRSVSSWFFGDGAEHLNDVRMMVRSGTALAKSASSGN